MHGCHDVKIEEFKKMAPAKPLLLSPKKGEECMV